MLVTSWRFTIFDICKINCILRTRARGGETNSKVALKDCRLSSLPEHGKIVRAWLSHFLPTAAKNTEITIEINFQQQRRAGFGELKSADCIVYLSTAAC
jgi:hypothetical protein